jgi:hypothetical protein
MAKKMTKKEFADYYDKTGKYHDADPANPMNKELTGPSTLSIIIATPKPRPKKKMMGGGYTKKAEMAYGGSVKGKKHMYAAGGSVTDNPGLKALRASGPGGMEAYNKITGN